MTLPSRDAHAVRHLKSAAAGLCLGFAAALALVGCYGEKEAMDPHDILAEDPEGLPAADNGEPPPLPNQPDSTNQKRRSEVPASRADCERAVRHMIVLGQRLEQEQEQDPGKRKELEARHRGEFTSDVMQQRIKALTGECLEEGKTRRETQCIEQIKREQEIDRCVP